MCAIRLLPIDSALAASLKDYPRRVEGIYGIVLGDAANLVQSVVEQTRSMPSASVPPWGGYLAVDMDSSTVIGTCAFKDVPAPDGTVEIAYFTFPDFKRLVLTQILGDNYCGAACKVPSFRF